MGNSKIIFDVEDDTKDKFKKKCIDNKTSMSKILREFVKYYVGVKDETD